jgi:GT2 family glycosyltransferase
MRISVVIPSYNAASFLPHSIGAIRAQTRAVHEVIVVDDGSSDGSREVATALGATCLRTAVNSGPAAARNIGIRHATGDAIAFLDADDFWDADHCANTVRLLERWPDALAAFAGVRYVGDPLGPPARHQGAFETPLDLFWTLLETNVINESAIVARRSALLDAGGYDETMRFSEDYDLWLRLALRGRFVAAEPITANYRVHGAQTTSRAAERLANGRWRARAHARGEAVALGWRAPQLERLDETLRSLWRDDLRCAWRSGDRVLLDATLRQSELVPGSGALLARWQQRTRRYWALWTPLVATWGRLPPAARAALKWPLRLLPRASASA